MLILDMLGQGNIRKNLSPVLHSNVAIIDLSMLQALMFTRLALQL